MASLIYSRFSCSFSSCSSWSTFQTERATGLARARFESLFRSLSASRHDIHDEDLVATLPQSLSVCCSLLKKETNLPCATTATVSLVGRHLSACHLARSDPWAWRGCGAAVCWPLVSSSQNGASRRRSGGTQWSSSASSSSKMSICLYLFQFLSRLTLMFDKARTKGHVDLCMKRCKRAKCLCS